MELSGFRILNRKGLNKFEPILEEWTVLTEKYSSTVIDDASYWYNEMANVGILMAAAWQCNFVAIPESTHVKGRGRQKNTTGRLDLYITDGEWDAGLEAKIGYLPLNPTSDFQKRVKDKMDVATDDALRSIGRYHLETYSVGFFPFFLSKAQLMKQDEWTEAKIVSIIESKFHGVAWCFPKSSRELKGRDERYYPGVAMVVLNTKFD